MNTKEEIIAALAITSVNFATYVKGVEKGSGEYAKRRKQYNDAAGVIASRRMDLESSGIRTKISAVRVDRHNVTERSNLVPDSPLMLAMEERRKLQLSAVVDAVKGGGKLPDDVTVADAFSICRHNSLIPVKYSTRSDTGRMVFKIEGFKEWMSAGFSGNSESKPKVTKPIKVKPIEVVEKEEAAA